MTTSDMAYLYVGEGGMVQGASQYTYLLEGAKHVKKYLTEFGGRGILGLLKGLGVLALSRCGVRRYGDCPDVHAP